MAEERFEARVEGILPFGPEKAWEALATAKGFPLVYEGITTEGDFRVGGSVVWSGTWEGKTFRDEGTVLAYDAPRRFVYTYWTSFWGKERSPETTQTITNEFEPVPGGTKVTITQSNIPSAESRDHSAQNWADILKRMGEVFR